MLDKNYMKVTLDGKVYYREVLDDNTLGEMLDANSFHQDLLAATLDSVVTEVYQMNLNHISGVIDRIKDDYDRQILRNFLEYAARLEGVV